MIRCSLLAKAFVLMLFLGNFAMAQQQAAEKVPEKIKDQVSEIGKTIDKVPAVQEASAGILQPIYQAAEYIGFPAFYWVAFALMTAGLISFAGQLVFAKLFLLFRLHLNIKEIMADILGLLISVVGLILTTQAATENSEFTRSPIAVISSAAVGVVLGLVFYWWGQSQEFRAAQRPAKTVKETQRN